MDPAVAGLDASPVAAPGVSSLTYCCAVLKLGHAPLRPSDNAADSEDEKDALASDRVEYAKFYLIANVLQPRDAGFMDGLLASRRALLGRKKASNTAIVIPGGLVRVGEQAFLATKEIVGGSATFQALDATERRRIEAEIFALPTHRLS
jgi:hypothetical protein